MSGNADDRNAEEERLKGRDVKKLERKTQRIEVKRGNAWISLEGEDILLEPGEEVTIRSSEHAGVISASGKDSMVFNISDVREDLKAATDEEIRLKGREAKRLDKKTQLIEIKRGDAWVSLGVEDILLRPGETMTIRSNKHGAVVSSADKDSLVFNVRDVRAQLKAAEDEED